MAWSRGMILIVTRIDPDMDDFQGRSQTFQNEGTARGGGRGFTRIHLATPLMILTHFRLILSHIELV